MKEDAQFYVVQKALIKKGDEILVLIDPIEGLDVPGGKIQEGEKDLVESLKREVREETGLEIQIGVPFFTLTSTYTEDHRLAGKGVFLVAYTSEYISGEVQLSEEHTNYRWVNRENYIEVNDGTDYFNIIKTYFSLF